MKLNILKGSTNVTIYIFIEDSSSTVGAGLTGLVFNSGGLTLNFVRPLGSVTALALATQTDTGAHTDGGFVEISSSLMRGTYRLDLSDAIIASGVDSVALELRGAINMVDLPIEIQLTSVDMNDATAFGLSRLDADISSRLAPTVAGRTLDVTAAGEAGIDLDNTVGTLGAAEVTAVGQVSGNVTGNVNGNVVGSVASVTGSVGSVTGAVGSVTGNIGGNVVGTVASITGNVDGNVTGSVGSVLGAVASVTGAVGSVTGNVGGNIVGTVASVVGSVGSVSGNVDGNVTGSVGSVLGAVASVTGAVGSVTGNVGGNVVGTVASVVGAVGSVSGNVDGNVTGTVASVVGNVSGNVVGTVASVVGAVGSVTGNVGGNVVGSVASVTAAVDMDMIAGSTTAANRLQRSADVMVIGSVDDTAFAPTTTQFETNLTEDTADHYNSRSIYFTAGILDEQKTDITDYSLVGGRGFFTVAALTEPPGNNDTFLIV